MEIRTMYDKLRKNGFNYTLILRNDRYAIYEQGGIANLTYYEVFKIVIKKPYYFKDKYFQARELFPRDEDFGKTAWSKRTLEEAMEKYNELNGDTLSTRIL